jgi:hypothetical protein
MGLVFIFLHLTGEEYPLATGASMVTMPGMGRTEGGLLEGSGLNLI